MKWEPDKKLHSREHVLADDLSQALHEPKRFAAYLGIARMYEESDLRGLLRVVLEKHDLPREARGKYFFACLKGLVKKPNAIKTKKKKITKKKKDGKKAPDRTTSAGGVARKSKADPA